MEERTKQRLVGVLVFVGALFIILPFLFHNSRPSDRNASATNSATAVSVAIPAENNAAPAATVVAQNDVAAGTAPVTETQPASPDQPAPVGATSATDSPMQAAPAIPAAPVSAPGAASTSTSTSTQPAATPSAAPAAMPATPQSFPSITQQPGTNAPASTPAPAPASPAAAPATTTVPASNAVPAPANTASPADGNANTGANTDPAMPPATKDAAGLTTGQAQDQSIGAEKIVAATTPVSSKTPTVVTAKTAEKTVMKKTAARKASVTNGWTIQLGVFSQKSNAIHLAKLLREHHFRVYARDLNRGNHVLTVVYVGPERNLEHARLAQEHLRTEFKLNGDIKRYQS